MRSNTERQSRLRRLLDRLEGERGIVVVVVMMFCLIFLVLGLALYWLSTSQIRATETERKDVKSFNVAEAGVHAGMLALKLDWPFNESDNVAVSADLIEKALKEANATLYDAERSEDDFLQVSVYDNSEPAGGVGYDANEDGKMIVDAIANVQDDRHRIMVQAEYRAWELSFPIQLVLYSNDMLSNAQGLGIIVEVYPPDELKDEILPIEFDIGPPPYEKKGLEETDEISDGTIENNPDLQGEFGTIITPSLLYILQSIAVQNDTYYDYDSAEDQDALDALLNDEEYRDKLNGAIIYVKGESDVTISGTDLPYYDEDDPAYANPAEHPIILVIDSPSSDHTLDISGNSGIYGVVIVTGTQATLSGTPSVHGAMYVEGMLLNSGNGVDQEIQYNYDVIANINRQQVVSVNIVPNTWEEYTGAAGVTTTTAP